MQLSRLARVLAIGLALALPAAGEIYEWTNAAGVKQFTTDLSKVPPSQRDAAVARARRESKPPASQARASDSATPGTRVRGLMQSHLSAEAFAAWRGNLTSTPRPEGAESASGGVWMVLMETGYERGSSTLLAGVDGQTELLLSVGGGLIWGGDVPEVNARARRMAARAGADLALLPPVAHAPLPARGEVRFIALTSAGLRSASAPQAALASGRHPLSALFRAGHDVLTALREESEAKGISL